MRRIVAYLASSDGNARLPNQFEIGSLETVAVVGGSLILTGFNENSTPLDRKL